MEQLRRELDPTTDVHREVAVLRAEFAEFRDRAKANEAWGRGLIASVLVALLSSVVALIAALTRK